MPIGPRDAIVFGRLPKRIKQLEEYIDRFLRRNYTGESWIEIPIIEIDSNMLKQLITDYGSAGWKKVEFLEKDGRKTAILKLMK